MPIARVFPRRTSATPDDEYAFVGEPPFVEFLPSDIAEVHVSVTFTWDIPFARHLVQTWRHIAPVKIGGPALGSPALDFEPGMYLKQGYLFTSRGCPNNCWFCDVPRREGPLRELNVKEGWNILDSNLLACSEGHVRKVFDMLCHRKEKVLLTGGLEAERLREWHVELFEKAKVQEAFFAYDLPDDLPALKTAHGTGNARSGATSYAVTKETRRKPQKDDAKTYLNSAIIHSPCSTATLKEKARSLTSGPPCRRSGHDRQR